MIKYLIKSTCDVRVETEEDANQLHKECEKYAHDNNYILSSWAQNLKERKAKGEVIESWVLCRYVLIFNDVKEPETLLNDIKYEMEGDIDV